MPSFSEDLSYEAFESRGRCSGSGIVYDSNGNAVPHRCQQTLVARTSNGLVLKDPWGQFYIELDRFHSGTGWIREDFRENILSGEPPKTENIFEVEFSGGVIERGVLRVESPVAPCFWLEVTRIPPTEILDR